MNESLNHQRLAWTATALAAVAISACTGPVDVQYDNVVQDNPAVDLGDRNYVDPPPVQDGNAQFTGNVKDYLTGEYVGAATLSSYGLTPQVTGTGEAGGGFALTVPVASTFYMSAYASGFAYTYTYVDMTAVIGDLNKDLYIVSQSTLDEWAAAFGKTQNADCAVVIVTAKNNANQPQANVDGVSMTGTDYEGPYYIAADGYTADPGATYTSDSGRMVFFNVCDPGVTSVTNGKDVSVTAAEGDYTGATVYPKVFSGGVSIATILVQAGGAPPPPDPNDVIDFSTQIVPIFQKYGCAACHSVGGQAEGTGLYFNDPPQDLWNELRQRPTVVNVAAPEQSLLLVRPLVEDPPDHPNGSFESTYNPDYQLILQWITGGAPYGVGDPPPLDTPVYFYEDLFPIFQDDPVAYPQGRGCAGCHYDGYNGGPAAGGLDFTDAQTAYDRIVAANLYDVNYPERSGLLLNPYCGPDNDGNGIGDNCNDDQQYGEVHPYLAFVTDLDPDYVKIYQWAAQGAPYAAQPPVQPPVGVDFATQLQYRYATRGCVGCHSKEDPFGGLSLVGTPQEVYDAVYARITVNDPANSLIYTKPNAAYAQVNHTGPKQIPNNDDPFALYHYAFINEGAQFVAPPPVNFSNDVYPIFQARGCTGCHGAAGGFGGLNLGGTPQDAYNALTDPAGPRVVAGYPAQSLILTKAFDVYADVNHNGGKTAAAQYYNEYQTIANWIAEGANYQ